MRLTSFLLRVVLSAQHPSRRSTSLHRRSRDSCHQREDEDQPGLLQLRRAISTIPCPPRRWDDKSNMVQDLHTTEPPGKLRLCPPKLGYSNKVTELSDHSVCTTWGKKSNALYLLHVYRKKIDYPTLKRGVIEQAGLWGARAVVIEDKASGTQLIQELAYEGGVYNIQSYQPEPNQDKVMRMFACCNLIENGLLYLPEKADWLAEYINELTVFPNGKYDDQVDSASQALDWIKRLYLKCHTTIITTVSI